MSYLFFPQNETHIANMLPIAKLLQEKYDAKICFINIEQIYKQKIYPNDFDYDMLTLDLSSSTAFSLLGFRQKIRLINRFKKELLATKIGDYNSLIIGNDGALQRLVMAQYPAQKTFLILDGIISDYSFSFFDIFRFSNHKILDIKDYVRRKIKYFLNLFFHKLPYNYYLPSDVGNSELDKIYVISEYVKLVLQKQNVKKEKIIVSGMPRYKFIEKIKQENRSEDNAVKNILLITQGYAWHNEHENDTYQHYEVKKVIALVEKLNKYSKRYNLVIRLHPRDDINNYHYVEKGMIEEKTIDIYDSLSHADIILGFNSTVLLEALYIRKKVLILMTSGQYWRFKRSFISNEVFEKIFSIAALEQALNSNKKNTGIEYFFNPNSETAEQFISDNIANGTIIKDKDSI